MIQCIKRELYTPIAFSMFYESFKCFTYINSCNYFNSSSGKMKSSSLFKESEAQDCRILCPNSQILGKRQELWPGTDSQAPDLELSKSWQYCLSGETCRKNGGFGIPSQRIRNDSYITKCF